LNISIFNNFQCKIVVLVSLTITPETLFNIILKHITIACRKLLLFYCTLC